MTNTRLNINNIKNNHKLVNCITINTDASFHPDEKVGGYAFYIVCDLFKIKKSGSFKNKLKSSMDAEMKCMVNAFHTLLAQKELPATKWIVVNSDCLNSFEKIKLKSKHEIGKKIALMLKQVRTKTSYKEVKPKFQFRHVKAHNGTPDSRSYVNNWCDREAKKWMRFSLKNKKK